MVLCGNHPDKDVTWQPGNSHALASSRASKIASAAATQSSAVPPYADVLSEVSWPDWERSRISRKAEVINGRCTDII